MKKIFKLLYVCLFSISIIQSMEDMTSSDISGMTIVSINSQRIYAELEKLKAEQQKIQQELNAMVGQLETLGKEVKGLENQIRSASENPDAADQKATEANMNKYLEKSQQLQQLQQEVQSFFQEAQMRFQGLATEYVTTMTAKFIEKFNYSMIINAISSKPEFDVTTQFIKFANEEYTKEKSKAKKDTNKEAPKSNKKK